MTAWQFGSSFVGTWRTDGAVCTSTSNHPENIAAISVVQRPKHGIAGKNGPYGIAYKPDSGFRGNDSFVYTVTSNAITGKALATSQPSRSMSLSNDPGSS
jgi:hypothetical protein